MKRLILKEIADRCPKDNQPIFEYKCQNCKYRGCIWTVDKPSKPFSFKVACKFEGAEDERI